MLTVELRIGEERNYGYNFGESFDEFDPAPGDADTIATASPAIVVPDSDAAVDGLVLGTPSNDDKNIQVTIATGAGAVAGAKYLIKAPIVTNGGRKLVGEWKVKIIG